MDNADRMRRAESWFERGRTNMDIADKITSDGDRAALQYESYIFLWISFNAAYGQDPLVGDDLDLTESGQFNEFLRKILERDINGSIKIVLLGLYPDPIRNLMKNHYVFQPFWKWVRNPSTNRDWRKQIRNRNLRIFEVLNSGQVDDNVLSEIFSRLYQLRNQIFHGGATFAVGKGWSQLGDGSRIMVNIVPKILNIMQSEIEKNPDTKLWGTVAYPFTTH